MSTPPISSGVDRLLATTQATLASPGAAGPSPTASDPLTAPPLPTAPQSRGRQEGFVIAPAEVIAMIDRAMAAQRELEPERRNPRRALMLLLGFAYGLRVTDFVELTWDQVLNYPEFTLHEAKHATRRLRRDAKLTDGRPRKRRTARPRVVVNPPQVMDRARELYDLTPRELLHPTYVFGKVHARGAARTMQASRAENPERWSSRAMCTDFKRTCALYGSPRHASLSAYYSCCRPTYGRWRFEIIQAATGSFDMAVAAVQAEFNHASPEMTKRYLKLGMKDERTRAAVNEQFMNFELDEQPSLTQHYGRPAAPVPAAAAAAAPAPPASPRQGGVVYGSGSRYRRAAGDGLDGRQAKHTVGWAPAPTTDAGQPQEVKPLVEVQGEDEVKAKVEAPVDLLDQLSRL